MKNRERSVKTFLDGDQFKLISADLALVQSCVDCHNQHPKATRRDFRRWDVMGGLVERLKRDIVTKGTTIGPEPSHAPFDHSTILGPVILLHSSSFASGAWGLTLCLIGA